MNKTSLAIMILSCAVIHHSQTLPTDSATKNAQLLEEYFLKACGGGFAAESKLAKGQTPKYLSENAKKIIEGMITAHGGMAKWNGSPTLKFTSTLVFGGPLKTEFWISSEITDIKTERTYQDWIVFDGKLTHDGSKTWTQNWKLDNPPGVNVNATYRTLALPWLTQNADVILEELPKAKLDASGDPLMYDVVKMTFRKGSKHSEHQYYNLFVHPQTRRLTGIQFNITHGAFLDIIGLPKSEKSLGPYTHIVYTHKNVDGLVFPEKYDTFDPFNHNAGRHIIYDYSLRADFDEARMKMPAGAILDTSQSERP